MAEQIISRFDLLSRQPLLLVFAVYQFITGLILAISPMLFLRLTSLHFRYDLIEDHGGPWPHMVGVSIMIQGIPYVVCYLMKYDVMYKTIIYSRLLSLAYYTIAVFHLKHASFTLIMTLGSIEVFWVVISFLLVLYNNGSMKNVPKIVNGTNVKPPSTAFQVISAVLATVEAAACLFVPSLWCTLIGQRSPPLVNLYIRWYGFMQLLTVFFVHFKARTKGCNVILYAHELFGRVMWVVASVALMYNNEVMIASTGTAMYIIYNNSMIMWALFEIKRKFIDPADYKFED